MPEVPKPQKRDRKKKISKKKKLLPLPKLIKKADIIFSKFIRSRDSIYLNGKCCTCGQPGSQAGHFIKRGHHSVRFNPKNVHLQCGRCNHFMGGNDSEYARFIINEYGIETFNWLLDQKNVTHKFTREELNLIIIGYS
jgi:hypothetical protein